MLFASLSQFTYNDILQTEKTRLPATFSSLTPDCSSIDVAEKSNQPEDWLLHPVGFVFQFDSQKALKPASPDSNTDSDTLFDELFDNDSADSSSSKDTFIKRLKSFLSCSCK